MARTTGPPKGSRASTAVTMLKLQVPVALCKQVNPPCASTGRCIAATQCTSLKVATELSRLATSPHEANGREGFWKRFLSNPSEWWDNRFGKKNPTYLVLRHIATEDALWLDSRVHVKLRQERNFGACKTFCHPGFDDGSDNEGPSRVLGYQEDLQAANWSNVYQYGQHTDAVAVLDALVQQGYYVDIPVLYSALKRCIAHKNLVLGSRIHALTVKCGYESNAFMANHIICMYASHGRLEEAIQVFTKVLTPCRYMWASIIFAHARHGQPAQAVTLYRQMRKSNVKPDNHIFVAVLKACASAEDLPSGRQVHADILGTLDKPSMFVGTCLVDMYSKCGSLKDARIVFDNLPSRDVVTWTVMIAGYAQHGLGQEALSLYGSMQQEGMSPADAVTFVCLLQACASVAALEKGKEIHAQISNLGIDVAANLFVANGLIDMYSKCGSLEDARRLFDKLPTKDVVTWSAMIAAYSQHGLGQEALTLYTSMEQGGITPVGAVTFVSLLQACSSVRGLHQGRQLHAQIQERGLEGDVVVGTCLVDMYAKCGSLNDAENVFNKLPSKNVVTWNVMIGGYADRGLGQEAFNLYNRMQLEDGTSADGVTLVCLMQVCGSVAGLEKGKEIHNQISKIGLEVTDLLLANALIDMYSKCGSMNDAEQVFSTSPTKDIVTWNALIAGYARQGESELVFELFQRMREEAIQPDSITFLGLLTVCSHVGLVDEGQESFEAMSRDYGVSPTIEHYTCMVDLLGRAGYVDRAMETVRTMPFKPDSAVWRCILGACRKWKMVGLGRQAFDCAVRFDKDNAAAYVLMSNIYAAAQMQDEAKKIRTMRVQSQVWKKPGQSWWTDTGGVVHTFAVWNREHPDWQHIDAKLKELVAKIKKEGYVPHLDSVLRDIPDDEKEAALCGHSEKLAIAYALYKTPEGATIRVVKNLRVCEDCHAATALISKIERRTIICRDANRFHVFRDGKCSCGDYW